eukprot:10632388-Ditylum_brightwellii.AAC.1
MEIIKKIQQNAASIRDKHLSQIAAKLLKKRTGNIDAIVNNIEHCKATKLVFNQLHLITKGNTGGVILYIKVPDKISLSAMYDSVLYTLGFAPEYTPIDHFSKIMPALMQQNKIHLHQAFDMSFAS